MRGGAQGGLEQDGLDVGAGHQLADVGRPAVGRKGPEGAVQAHRAAGDDEVVLEPEAEIGAGEAAVVQHGEVGVAEPGAGAAEADRLLGMDGDGGGEAVEDRRRDEVAAAHGGAQPQQVADRGEQARVAGDAAERVGGIAVVDLAAQRVVPPAGELARR